jgi:hypothetical protein
MYGDTDAGSGPNIWNWKALGVSCSLWNMVRACLKSGMRKEIILHLIYSIQHGVPEDGASSSIVPAAAGNGGEKDGSDEAEAENAEKEPCTDHNDDGRESTANHVR